MQPGMTDETFWNLKTAQRIAKLGTQRGLNIRFYDPGVRTIHNGDDPRTNWSTGKRHVQRGGYALEIHYDAYGRDGYGSGVIPRVYGGQTVIDEHLARGIRLLPLGFPGGCSVPPSGASPCWRWASWKGTWKTSCAIPPPATLPSTPLLIGW